MFNTLLECIHRIISTKEQLKRLSMIVMRGKVAFLPFQYESIYNACYCVLKKKKPKMCIR